MKKIICFFSAFVFLGATIIACAPEKKDLSNRNTFTVSIESVPAPIGDLDYEEDVSLKATLKNYKGEAITDNVKVVWSVEPQELGTFSSYDTFETIFTSASSGNGYGKIYADCNGVKGSIDFSLKSVPISSISIDGPAEMTTLDTKAFNAVAKDSNGEPLVPQPIINWSIDNPTLGNITPTQGAKTYLTTNSINGTLKLTASYSNIKADKFIEIGSSTPVIPRRLLYSDAGLGDNVCTAFGYYYGGGGSSTITEISGGADEDPSTSYKITFNGKGWAGWYFAFGTGLATGNLTPQDLSSFTKLVFWAKGEQGQTLSRARIEFKNHAGNTVKRVYDFTDTWQRYELPITSVNRTEVSIPFNIVFAVNDNGTPAETIYIDHIYFE